MITSVSTTVPARTMGAVPRPAAGSVGPSAPDGVTLGEPPLPARGPWSTPIESLPMNPEVERYISITGMGSPQFSKDGRSLLFLSNESGTAQIWTLDLQSGQKQQLSHFDQPVAFFERLEDGCILFGSNTNGTERTQLLVMPADGSDVRALTNDPTTIHQYGAISDDGRSLVYSANARNKAVFDIYVMDVVTGESRMVFESDGSINPVGFTPDGKGVLYAKSNTNLDEDLYLLDLTSGQTRKLTPHQGEASYSNIHWENDHTLRLITNQDREYFAPALLDLNSGQLTILEERPGECEAMTSTKDGRFKVLRYNEEGYSKLYVMDSQCGGVRSAEALPRGVVRSMALSPDERSLVFNFSGPTSNSALYRMDLESGALTPILQGTLNGIDPATLVEERLVSYPTFDGRQIPAFLYLPKGMEPTNLPAIVSVHGGPESQSRPDFSGLFQYMASQGYAVLVPNIRGSVGYGKTFTHLDDIEKRPDAITDVARAAEYLKTSGIADPARIAVQGGSYGGYMTLAQLAMHPEVWACGVDIVGMSNLLTFMEHTGPWRKHLRTPEYGDPEKHRDLLVELSPITHVDNIQAPLMVIQGANDPRVPQIEADQIVEAVRNNGGEVEYLLFPDEGHGLAKKPNRVRGYSAMMEFLDKHLKGNIEATKWDSQSVKVPPSTQTKAG